jgi:hypothetical protein
MALKQDPEKNAAVNPKQMGFSGATELGFVSGHDFSRAVNELKKWALAPAGR